MGRKDRGRREGGKGMISDKDLKSLAEMWEETAMVFDKNRYTSACPDIAASYRDCARDLRAMLSGDMSPIEEIKR